MRSLILAVLALAFTAGAGYAQPTFVQKEAGAPYVAAASPYLGYVQLGQGQAEKLTQGVDYSGRIYIDPAKFPNNSVIAWSVPYRTTVSGKPWGFPALSRGRPSGGMPKVLDPVKRVGDVQSLTLRLDTDLSLFGAGSDASVLSDTFFFKDATLQVAVAELGVFPYAGPAAKAFISRSEKIRNGFYRDPFGRTWTARKAGVYFMFSLETGDALKGEIDLRGFMDFLVGAGLLTNDMIYPGTALGVEPGAGAGTLKVNTFDVTAP